MAWYRKQKFPTSLTSVASLGINAKASGSKQGTAKRQRNSKDDVLQYNSSLVESIENGGNQVEDYSTTSTSLLPSYQWGLVQRGDLIPTSSVQSSSLQLAGHPHSYPHASSLQVLPTTQFSSEKSPGSVSNSHAAVPPGQPLPPKPTLPETPSPYFLTKL